MMKIAYCGIDLLCTCLSFLLEREVEICRIYTLSYDPYDPICAVTDLAHRHGIPLKTTPIGPSDLRALEELGVELMIVAGYPGKIPLSEKIRQVNVHPAMLPMGRGAWPMPVTILKNLPSGVTLHKLAAGFDTGDILLQREIPLEARENLESLTGKIQRMAPMLLGELLENLDRLWADARPQGLGEYWPEPGVQDRLLSGEDDAERAGRLLRAFWGYGVLYRRGEELLEIPYGEVMPVPGGDGLYLPLKDGWLWTETWKRYPN